MEVTKWQPHSEIQHELSVQGFRYEGQALVIVLGDFENNGIFRMTFPSPLAFRCTDELHLNVCYNPRDFKGSQFYIVKDSAYLDWFRQSSGCVTLKENVVHYVIFTWDDCFDIISMETPLVIWEPIKKKQLSNLSSPPWVKGM